MRLKMPALHGGESDGIAHGAEHGDAGDVPEHRGIQIHGDAALYDKLRRRGVNLNLRPGSRGRAFTRDLQRQRRPWSIQSDQSHRCK